MKETIKFVLVGFLGVFVGGAIVAALTVDETIPSLRAYLKALFLTNDGTPSGTTTIVVDGQDGSITMQGDLNIQPGAIKDNTIVSADIANGTIRAEDIGAGQVVNTNLAANSVTSDKIVDGTITAADLGANSVGISELQNNSVTSAKIRDGEIRSVDIRDGTISAADLGANSVGISELQNNSVTSAKIRNGEVGRYDLSLGVRNKIDANYCFKFTVGGDWVYNWHKMGGGKFKYIHLTATNARSKALDYIAWYRCKYIKMDYSSRTWRRHNDVYGSVRNDYVVKNSWYTIQEKDRSGDGGENPNKQRWILHLWCCK